MEVQTQEEGNRQRQEVNKLKRRGKVTARVKQEVKQGDNLRK